MNKSYGAQPHNIIAAVDHSKATSHSCSSHAFGQASKCCASSQLAYIHSMGIQFLTGQIEYYYNAPSAHTLREVMAQWHPSTFKMQIEGGGVPGAGASNYGYMEYNIVGSIDNSSATAHCHCNRWWSTPSLPFPPAVQPASRHWPNDLAVAVAGTPTCPAGVSSCPQLLSC
jgi:hypothetical protein